MKDIFFLNIVYDFSELMGIYMCTTFLENNLTVNIKTLKYILFDLLIRPLESVLGKANLKCRPTFMHKNVRSCII